MGPPNFHTNQGPLLYSQNAWTYSPGSKSGTVYGAGHTHPADGGYTAELHINRNVTLVILDELKAYDWLDRSTQVLILDFSLYNANTNLFCHVYVVGEVSLSGAVLMSAEVVVFPMSLYIHGPVSVVVVCQALFVILVLTDIVILLWNLGNAGPQILLIPNLLLKLLFVALAIYEMIVYAIRQFSMERAMQMLRSFPQKYVSFAGVMSAHEASTCGLAFLIFVATINLLHALKFHPPVYRFGFALISMMKPLMWYVAEAFFFYFALTHFAYLTFGTDVLSYAGIENSAVSILLSTIGSYKTPSAKQNMPGLGRMYTLLLSLGINALCIGALVTIIIQALASVQTNSKDSMKNKLGTVTWKRLLQIFQRPKIQ